MGLLTIIKKVKAKEKEMRILIVGLDNAGKTTIVKRLNGEDISTISPTLGFNIKSMAFKGYKLNLWDVGGQRSLRPFWRNYFERTDGLVWVVDACDTGRLADCAAELTALLAEERLQGAPLLVLANKQDVAGALQLHQVEEELQLSCIAKRQARAIGCSAVTGHGLLQGFDWLVSSVAGRMYALQD